MKKYLYRGTIFSVAGAVATGVDLLVLYILTQAGLWYMYGGIIGTLLGGVVHYNLNVISGNIKIVGKLTRAPVCEVEDCTARAERFCSCGKLLCQEHLELHQ